MCYRKDYDSDIHGLEITIAPWYDGADYEVYYHIVSKEDVKAFTLDSDASIVLTNPHEERGKVEVAFIDFNIDEVVNVGVLAISWNTITWSLHEELCSKLTHIAANNTPDTQRVEGLLFPRDYDGYYPD